MGDHFERHTLHSSYSQSARAYLKDGVAASVSRMVVRWSTHQRWRLNRAPAGLPRLAEHTQLS
jgi:hypothetical protein